MPYLSLNCLLLVEVFLHMPTYAIYFHRYWWFASPESILRVDFSQRDQGENPIRWWRRGKKRPQAREAHCPPRSSLSPSPWNSQSPWSPLLCIPSSSLHDHEPGSLQADRCPHVTVLRGPLLAAHLPNSVSPLPPPGLLPLPVLFFYIRHINVWHLLFYIFCFLYRSSRVETLRVFSAAFLSYKTCVIPSCVQYILG